MLQAHHAEVEVDHNSTKQKAGAFEKKKKMKLSVGQE